MQIKKWTNAVAFLEENEDSLSSSEQNAIKTLQNIWRSKKFGPDCTTSVENMVKLLSDSDKLHHGANNLIQASKEFRGAAKLFYTTDEETFKQFADYMKKTAGGPQLSDDQQRRREQAQQQRRREAEQYEEQRRRQQEEQRRRQQEEQRRRQQPKKSEFIIRKVEFIDQRGGADAVMGTSANPFPNNVTYIAPKIHYYYSGNGETIPVQVTYYRPDGSMIEGAYGRTCSMICDIEVASEGEWWFYQGFGNDEGTSFSEPGEYKVVIARNGVRLWTGTFLVKGKRPYTPPPTQPKKKSGCLKKIIIGVLLLWGCSAVYDCVGDLFSSDKPKVNFQEVFEGTWDGEFQNHDTRLVVSEVDNDDYAYADITVKFRSRTETHSLKGLVEVVDDQYKVVFEDKDINNKDYLNGRYILLLNKEGDCLSGNYENYDTGKLSEIVLNRNDGDGTAEEKKEVAKKEREKPAADVDDYAEENREFLVKNRSKSGVLTTSSGLQYKVITNGNGPIPSANDKVKISYKSYLIDGTMTDSAEGVILNINQKQVIKGLQEALTMMPVGSNWEVYIPSDLAFGTKGAGKIKPNSTMIFHLELLDVIGADNTASENTASETPNQAEQSATETTSSSNGTGFRLETGSADTGADNKIYYNYKVDVQPEFPGGSQALYAYLGNNVKYPQAAAERGVQGKVVVSFVVERDGSISQAKVVRAIDQDLGREALRVILAMPRWKPGSMGGNNVRVRYELPITFRLK